MNQEGPRQKCFDLGLVCVLLGQKQVHCALVPVKKKIVMKAHVNAHYQAPLLEGTACRVMLLSASKAGIVTLTT